MIDNTTNRTKSVTERVRETIRMRPSIIDALKMKIVNYSALARMLKRELGDVSIEAVKAAVIRIADELSKDRSLQEEKVLSILRESNVRLQDKIAVLTSQEILDIPYIVTAYLTDSYVYIVDQTKLKVKIPEHVKTTGNLTALILISPQRVETTPGFVAFMTHLLASRRINIIEFISCSTNTVIVLDSKDALNAFALIQNYV